MNEEAFNIGLRKFLKHFGVTAQREIERAVGAAIAEGKLRGDETITARTRLELDGVAGGIVVEGEIPLA